MLCFSYATTEDRDIDIDQDVEEEMNKGLLDNDCDKEKEVIKQGTPGFQNEQEEGDNDMIIIFMIIMIVKIFRMRRKKKR